MENIDEKIIWFYNEGLTITEVANKLGSTKRIVSRILHDNNIKIRSKNKCTPEEEKEIIARYKAGEKVASIAKEKSIGIHVVYGIFKRNNIKVDPPSKQHRIYKYNEHYFDTVDTQEKAYILGLIYADGTLVKNCISIFYKKKTEKF